MPVPHNVNQSRVILGEAKTFAKLPWKHGEEQLTFHAENDPDKVYYLVVEFHQDTGYFVLYSEYRYAEKFGGEVLHERSMEHVIRQQQAAEDRADAENEAAALGG